VAEADPTRLRQDLAAELAAQRADWLDLVRTPPVYLMATAVAVPKGVHPTPAGER
jgi:hypothetical protein